MKKLRLNLRGKFLLVVFLGLILNFTAVASIRIYLAKKSIVEEVERSGRERVLLIAEAYSNLLLAHDYSNMESLADRLVNVDDIWTLKVSNLVGKKIIDRKNADIDTLIPVSVFYAPINVADKKIGSVEIGIAHVRVKAAIKQVYYQLAVMIFIAAVFLGTVIYLVVSVFVIRPVVRLSEVADQLAQGNYAAKLPPASDDEMGNLVRTFAEMRSNRKLNEERLNAVFENSPDAFIQLNEAGNIIEFNQIAIYIFGYKKNEVLGKNFSIVMPPVELGLNAGYRSCYQKSENVIGVIREVVGQRKDGNLFPLQLRTSEIKLEDETLYVVSARDISELKANEAKLIQAIQTAESANAAKSSFLSNISHEIRTPMNSIIGMAGLALKHEEDPKQRDYLDKINYAAHHLLILINDILDFSKIEANKVELEMANFNLASVFENISNQFSHSALIKGLALNIDFASCAKLRLRGDPLRLSQVLLNFTSNAIKFTKQGSVNISVELLEEDHSAYMLRFNVQDTGIGIERDSLKYLFQPFHQTDASMSRKYGGTGLGLAICKQLALLMGGDVGVESELGKGSTFWFTARLGKGENKEAVKLLPEIDLSKLHGISVLLVDDNLFNQQVASEILRDAGIKVTIANNGKEAIESLQQKKFDCVLMDVQMPVMDGLETTRQIRANPALADTYIIAVTANAGQEDRASCFAAGMDSFVSKPIFSDQLFDIISRHLVAAGGLDEAEMVQYQTLQDDSKNDDQLALLDLSVLEKMLGTTDPLKVKKFALKFLLSAQQGLEEIETALEKEDLATLAALGHRNKSPAKTVGALAYAELCLGLEHFKNDGSVKDAEQLVLQMGAMLKKIEILIAGKFK
jgi:PAS domain S-box-containing protein